MQILSILALMERRRQSILALLLVAAMPTTSIVFALQVSDSEFLTQAFFIFAKIWIIAISLYWLYRVDNSKFSLQRTREGERSGLIIGSGMFFIILATYMILGESIDIEKMRAEIRSTGLLDRNTFLIGVVYWVIFNSLVEEFVFRKFVGERLLELTGSQTLSIIGSAAIFTLHHTVALSFYFVWWQTLLGTIGILVAGGIWSWLYLRYYSLSACWISHAIADVAVFGTAYLILF
jgi:membrane protease YdiL (CAAX protease family)